MTSKELFEQAERLRKQAESLEKQASEKKEEENKASEEEIKAARQEVIDTILYYYETIGLPMTDEDAESFTKRFSAEFERLENLVRRTKKFASKETSDLSDLIKFLFD